MATRHLFGGLLMTATLLALFPTAATATIGLEGDCVVRSEYTIDDVVTVWTNFSNMVCLRTDIVAGTPVAFSGTEILGYAGLVDLHITWQGRTVEVTVAGEGPSDPCGFTVGGPATVTCTPEPGAVTLYRPVFSSPTVCLTKATIGLYEFENDQTHPHYVINNATAVGPCN